MNFIVSDVINVVRPRKWLWIRITEGLTSTSTCILYEKCIGFGYADTKMLRNSLYVKKRDSILCVEIWESDTNEAAAILRCVCVSCIHLKEWLCSGGYSTRWYEMRTHLKKGAWSGDHGSNPSPFQSTQPSNKTQMYVKIVATFYAITPNTVNLVEATKGDNGNAFQFQWPSKRITELSTLRNLRIGSLMHEV